MADNFFGITDPGKIRSNNEDTFIAARVMNEQFIAACVIDGVGGYEGGEVAASLAHDTILSYLQNPVDDIDEALKEALNKANEAIYSEKRQGKGNEHMACVLTLALANLRSNKLYFAHVGDTRLYLLRDDTLVKITKDHSFVGFLEDTGRLSEEAAMRHPKRNEINKALGFDLHISSKDYIETGESPFLPGDIILLCSDGLSDMIGNSEIKDILQSGKSLSVKGKALIEAANAAGGRDNITVVLVHNDKEPATYMATKPDQAPNDLPQNVKEVVMTSPNSSGQNMEPVIRKKRKSLVPFLIFLSLLLILAVLWLVYQNYRNEQLHQLQLENTTIIKKEPEEREKRLMDSLVNNSNTEIFVLHTPGEGPISITDTLMVTHDTLHIIGNGATLKCDESFRGPAFNVSANCRYLVIDSLSLEGFTTGIEVNSPCLILNSVTFINCKVPVRYNLAIPQNDPVNGRMSDSIFKNGSIVYN